MRSHVLSGVLLVSALLASPASAQAPFYSGRTLTITVSSDAGGGYDAYTRLLARHLPRHVPGNPTIVVQNEPGGGGLRAAQLLYSVVEKDGTRIGNLRGSNMLDSVVAIRGTEIDPRKYEWIGNMSSDTDMCSFWHTAGIRSFDDLRHKEVIVGASGKGAQNYSFPNAMNKHLGTKMKIILGYKGVGDRLLAVERGELQGNCGINSATLANNASRQLAEGTIIPIVQSGLKPHPAFPDVPLTQSFATNEDDRRVLVTIFSQMDMARIFAAPPGTPAERVRTLRAAFTAALEDPALVAEAAKAKMELDPSPGEHVARVIAEMAGISDELKRKVRAAIGE